MAVFDCVTDRRIDTAYDEGMLDYDGLIVHIAVSNARWPSYQPGTKAHFYARKDGSLGQEIDTRFKSGAQLNGNGHYLSVELQGGLDAGDLHAPMPQAQLETLGRLLAEANRRHGIPLQLMVDTRPNSDSSRGLGYHRLGVPYRGVYATRTLSRVESGWLQRSGDLWFSKSQGKECPGDGRISQIPQILALAMGGATGALIPPVTTTSEEDEMNTEQDRILREVGAVVGQLRGLLMVPDQPFGDPAHAKNQLDSLASQVASVAAGNILWPRAGYHAFPALANAVREDDDQPPAPSADEIARAMAPLVSANLAALSVADVQRIAAAAAEELATRLKG